MSISNPSSSFPASALSFVLAKGAPGAAAFAALTLALSGCGGKSFSKGDQPLIDECEDEQDEACEVGTDDGSDSDTDVGSTDPTGPASCMHDGEEIAHGDSIRVSCNTCSCDDGLLACTLIGCDPDPGPGPRPEPVPPGSCTTPDGQVFADGESFQLDCNTCGCLEGELLCTAIACETGCVVAGTEYEHGAAVPSADECETCVCEFGGVNCISSGCEPGGEPCAFGGVLYPSGESFSDGCNSCVCADGAVACTNRACPPEDGSCTVRGKTYPNGSSLPDPNSCNTCSCEDGEITICTEAHCPILKVKPCDASAERVDFPHDSASISDGYLSLGVTYSGGCAEHVFELCYDPFVFVSSTGAFIIAPGDPLPSDRPGVPMMPPQVTLPATTLHLTHVDPGDPCDGIVESELVFDLYPFTEAGYGTVNVSVGQDQLTYTSP